MTAPARINGHDSAHHLQAQREARVQYANALHKAQQYLELANMVAITNGLPYTAPSHTLVTDALETVSRDIYGKG